MPLLKNGFLEKIETWHVGLSCQYTHFTSFSSKSEHDTIADQATLILLLVSIFEKVALQDFLELFESPIFDVTRQSVPQSRCIGRKGLVTKGNTLSPWLDKSSIIRA